MYRPTLLAVLTLLLSHHVLALNILVIFSLPLRSHYMACQPLFRELASRGHSVTVLNNYPEENPVPNMTYVDLREYITKIVSVEYVSPLTHYEKFSSWYLHLYNFYRHFELCPPSTKRDCENLLTNANVTANFAKRTKYDVIFVEQFMGDCNLAYAAALYDAPIIGITSHVLLPLSYARLGIPFDFSSDSFYFGKGGPNPSLYHKVEAVILHFFYNTIGRIYIQRDVYNVFNKYLPNNHLDIEKAARERMKMMFVYQHFSLTGSRVLSPQVLEIGGIHIDKPKPVPEAIERFLSNAQHGAVYVGFGSNIKARTMSRNKLYQFLNAFKAIPQKVIWKYENDSLPVDYDKDNIYIGSWFPQLDILCHPKVVAFITHGGMLSISEAAHCGKPVLVVPFFADQFSNAAAARSVGLGQVLYFDHLTAESLAGKIQEVTSQEMQQNAKRVSNQWHDRPAPAIESAIYWTEYVARHGAMPPPLPAQRAAWFENMLLDVAAVLILMPLAIISIAYVIFKILRFLFKKSTGKVISKQKTKSKSE